MRPTSFPSYDWNLSDIAILKKVGEFHSDDRSKTAIAFQPHNSNMPQDIRRATQVYIPSMNRAIVRRTNPS
jgi:hypothetical protein